MSEFNFSEGFNSPETDYSVDVIHSYKLSLEYGLYSKLRGYTFHYNIVKLRYKLLSTTWLLATFIGFGTILSGEEAQLPFVNTIWIFLISILSSAGIIFLWFLDVRVYHRILVAVFLGSLDLESANPSLMKPQHNTIPLTYLGKISPVLFDGLFYFVQVFIILLIGWIALFYSLSDYTPIVRTFLLTGYSIGVLFLEFFMISHSYVTRDQGDFEGFAV